MIVEALQTKNIEVNISDSTVKSIVLDEMCRILDIPRLAYIKKGKLMVDVEYGGSHVWYDEKIIRLASENDVAAVLTIERMIKEL